MNTRQHSHKNRSKKAIPISEIKKLLKDRVLILDCGHRFCLHPLSNTMIMTSDGRTCCHNCY